MTQEPAVQGIRMHGAGNRVLLLDGATLGDVDPADIAIGCNGSIDSLLVMEDRGEDLVGVRVYNRDGSGGGMCGNGMRCVAAIQCPHGGETTIESDIGRHRATVEAKGDGQWIVTIDMPPAKLGAVAIGMATQAQEDGTVHADLGTGELQLLPVSTGNPHLVCIVDETPSPELVNMVGPAVQHLREGGVNLHLVKVLSSNALALLPIERGIGPTASCATGAQAAVAALHDRGLCADDVDIHMPGGTVRVQLGEPTHVTGEAAIDRSGEETPDDGLA